VRQNDRPSATALLQQQGLLQGASDSRSIHGSSTWRVQPGRLAAAGGEQQVLLPLVLSWTLSCPLMELLVWVTAAGSGAHRQLIRGQGGRGAGTAVQAGTRHYVQHLSGGGGGGGGC